MKINYPVTLRLAALAAATTIIGGCATTRQQYDYTAFKEARPASILVLPPINNSPDVNGTYSMMSQVTQPLAESGYYVFPVTLVDETFKQNGLTSPNDIHDVPVKKLREIFGADAALYINIKDYGTKYIVISSETRVTAAAKIVDLRTGKTLWSGAATASSAEGDSGGGGLAGVLIKAVVKQVLETSLEQGHVIAGHTSNRLLSAARPNGILYGPRSSQHQKEGVQTK
ncbi:MAG: hypothetical protein H6R04_220 [Burkholderiaceae bacterium]|nr:hypothetical protein [Burkholderiaceae bacterium]